MGKLVKQSNFPKKIFNYCLRGFVCIMWQKTYKNNKFQTKSPKNIKFGNDRKVGIINTNINSKTLLKVYSAVVIRDFNFEILNALNVNSNKFNGPFGGFDIAGKNDLVGKNIELKKFFKVIQAIHLHLDPSAKVNPAKYKIICFACNFFLKYAFCWGLSSSKVNSDSSFSGRIELISWLLNDLLLVH